MHTLICGGTIVTPAETLVGHCLVISGSTITAILPNLPASLPGGGQVIDAAGCFVTPGLIDLHIHGCAGADIMDAEPETLPTMSAFLARHGITSFLPTTISSTPASMEAAIEAYQVFQYTCEGARPLGLHLEGPLSQPPVCRRPAGSVPAPARSSRIYVVARQP